MKVKFWGVRGSYPVPGPTTNRYGGNTPCVQVCPDSGKTIILDAGTGIRPLGRSLNGDAAGDVHLLIGHTHWDHIQGLPFFTPLYTEGNRITIYARQRDVHLRTLFTSQTKDPYFPVNLADVSADVDYRELMEGTAFNIDDVTVRCARLNHPYIALGYRLEADGHSVVYISDTAPFDSVLLGYEFIASTPDLNNRPTGSDAAALEAMRQGVVDLCQDADLVIYDTMFQMNEYLACPHWGHSAPEHAVEIAEEANVRCLALFHHAPQRTDDQQDEVVRIVQEQTKIKVIGAAEGQAVSFDGDAVEVVSE